MKERDLEHIDNFTMYNIKYYLHYIKFDFYILAVVIEWNYPTQ